MCTCQTRQNTTCSSPKHFFSLYSLWNFLLTLYLLFSYRKLNTKVMRAIYHSNINSKQSHQSHKAENSFSIFQVCISILLDKLLNAIMQSHSSLPSTLKHLTLIHFLYFLLVCEFERCSSCSSIHCVLFWKSIKVKRLFSIENMTVNFWDGHEGVGGTHTLTMFIYHLYNLIFMLGLILHYNFQTLTCTRAIFFLRLFVFWMDTWSIFCLCSTGFMSFKKWTASLLSN